MRSFLRWWETLDRPERIVALSIGLAAPIAIVNSTVWAIAVCYIVRQRAQVEIERLRARAADTADHVAVDSTDAWQPGAQTPPTASAAGHAH